MQKKDHGILKGIWTLLTLGLVLLLFSPSQAWALNVYVMGGEEMRHQILGLLMPFKREATWLHKALRHLTGTALRQT